MTPMICCGRQMVRCRRFDTIPIVVPLNGMTVKYATQVAIMERRVETYTDGWECLACWRFSVGASGVPEGRADRVGAPAS